MPNKPILLLNVPYSILWTEHLHKNLKFSEIRWGIPQGPPTSDILLDLLMGSQRVQIISRIFDMEVV